MTALTPLPGRVLVELPETYQNVVAPDQKYATKTSGICVAVARDAEPAHYELTGRLVFWEEYKDGATIERDGKKYAFIKIEDLDGYEQTD